MMSSRAETGAVAQTAAAAASQNAQFLTFVVGRESFAAAISAIREIIEVPSLTAMPLVPDFVRGVINLRGAVVPVLDLATRLELGRTEMARRTCIVVVEVAGQESNGAPATQVLGLLVDAVNEVLEIAAVQIEPAPALGNRIPAEFIRGVAKVNKRLLVVLELARVLAPQELAELIGAR
jgi:purine-binding chemotaxis protein CheW